MLIFFRFLWHIILYCCFCIFYTFFMRIYVFSMVFHNSCLFFTILTKKCIIALNTIPFWRFLIFAENHENHVRAHPSTSEHIRAHPSNTPFWSEHIRAHPSTSEHIRGNPLISIVLMLFHFLRIPYDILRFSHYNYQNVCFFSILRKKL